MTTEPVGELGHREEIAPHFRSLLARSWALMISVLLVMTGAGLLGSLVAIRADGAGFGATVTGILVGAYYLGYVVGARTVGPVIRAVGHVRAFAGLAAVAATTAVALGLYESAGPWILLRGLTGICIAGLFIVAESWLNGIAAPDNRGRLLGVYMVAVTGGLTAGQVLLTTAAISELTLFAVASTIVTLSVVPVSLVPQPGPPIVEPRAYSIRELLDEAPLAAVGSTAAGVGSASILGFGAVYANRVGFDVSGVAAFIAAVLVGGTIGQPPLGRLSDRGDRRLALVGCCVLIAASSAAGVMLTDSGDLLPILACAAGVGAGLFPLYSVSLAHLADYVDADELTSAGSLLIVCNGMGAAVGPIAVGSLVDASTLRAFFLFPAVVFAIVAVYAVWRMTRRPAVLADDRAHYVPMPPGATPEVMELEAPELSDEID